LTCSSIYPGTISSVCSILVARKNFELLIDVIDMVMPALLEATEHPINYKAAFSTIFNIGKAVIESGKIDIIDHFESILVESPFCFPRFSGIAEDWSVIVNSNHLENIRTWMKLIELDPSVMKKLSASLIVNLKLGGVFLKDTDVFQRDISDLLNSNYESVFYLITSLAAVFPAFYHDIGATGNIRSFTEQIDTNHEMNDLIHFIRKQVHVESSTRTVELIQRVMEFWLTGDKKHLFRMVPHNVYENLDRIYRIINFNTEETAQKIYNEAGLYFGNSNNLKFWDFLISVGEDRFISFVEQTEFDDINYSEKENALSIFKEFFKTGMITEMTRILQVIHKSHGDAIEDTEIWKFLYEISDDDFREIFNEVSQQDISLVNLDKFITFLHVYRMLYDKYNFSEVRAIEKLKAYSNENLFTPPDDFFDTLTGDNIYNALETLIKTQNSLKNNILLSKEKFNPLDTVEFKRHIAFGIPSMYGFYKERKFDTLKVFFQMNLIRVRFFEKILESAEISGRMMDYEKIKMVLFLFYRTLLIDGLANQEMINIFNLLETPNLKLSQFRDIIINLLFIHGEISDRFNATFRYVCKAAIENIGIEKISKDYKPHNNSENIDIIIDRFLRNQIMQSPCCSYSITCC
jgi:hypothetical protein